jgi:hypothetical protein
LTFIVGYFNTPLLVIDGTARQKKKIKDIEEMNTISTKKVKSTLIDHCIQKQENACPFQVP